MKLQFLQVLSTVALWGSAIAASIRADGTREVALLSSQQLTTNIAYDDAALGGLQARFLQESTFQANYMARFQVLTDPFCQPDSPTIRVECSGTDIRVLNVSHPTITCNAMAETDFYGKSFISCQNTCVEDACKGVYLAVDVDSKNGIFGAVEFQCAGGAISDVQASLSFEGNAEQRCGGSVQGYNRIFHVAQLGVACPSGSGNTDYVYEDFYFECDGLDSFFTYQNRKELDGVDLYTCFTGENCDASACSIDIGWLTVQSKLATFQGVCVTPPQAVTTQPPLTDEDSELKMFTARFEAAWGNLYDDVAALWCTNDSPSVQISCRNGPIRFLNATATVECTTLNQSAMECHDSSSANVNDKFTGVSFVSEFGMLRHGWITSHAISRMECWTCNRNARGRRYRNQSWNIHNPL
jgi:hypothetical protein